MIISHSHNYAFFHCPKCAGTSISVNLSKHCTDQDIVTGHEYLRDVDDDFNEAKPRNSVGYTTHTLPYEVIIPEDYLKISAKRNPFDQVVSNYFWYRSQKPFEEFVLRELFIDCRPFWNGMDYYVDFHNLEESYRELCGKINIPYERLPRTKTKLRKDKTYRNMYTDKAREKIEEYYKNEIKKFMYFF